MDKYTARAIDDDTFYVENGQRSDYVRGAHCKCCALVKVITEQGGGQADLRGLYRYGPCYQFLAVISRQSGRDDQTVAESDDANSK